MGKDDTVKASSTSGGHGGSSYKCYLPLNCYAGHGADEIDYIHIEEGASISACAEACNEMWQCEGFVYMGTDRKCWRRRNIDCCDNNVCKNLMGGTGKVCGPPPPPPCEPQGQSCENSGDCCDDNVCKSLMGGKVCVAP